jgi:hypothetical protein
MPTLLVFRDGKEAGRRLGLTNQATIHALVAGSGRPERDLRPSPDSHVAASLDR